MSEIQNITYEDFKQIQRVAGVGSWEYDIISNRNYWSEDPPIGPFDTQFRIIRASLFIRNNSGYNRKN